MNRGEQMKYLVPGTNNKATAKPKKIRSIERVITSAPRTTGWKAWFRSPTTSRTRCCCCLTLTLVQHLESVITQRCWSPRKIRKTKWSQNLSGKYYAFPPKNARYEEGAEVKWSNVQTELTWPRVSTQLRRRVPPFPQLTNSRLQTTAVGLPAPSKPHGNREYRRTRLLSGVLSEWRPAGMQWKKINRTKNHLTNINDRPVFPGYLTGCSAATTPVPENGKLRGVVPHEGRVYNSTNSTKSTT